MQMASGMLLALAAVSVVAAATASAPAGTEALPPVDVRLRIPDSWRPPPFALELLESVAQESATSYFTLLSHLADHHLLAPSTKPKTVYDAFFSAPGACSDTSASAPSSSSTSNDAITSDADANKKKASDCTLPLSHTLLQSPDTIGVMKLALAMHNTAPRIEAYYRFYNQTVVPSFPPASFDTGCDVWVDCGGHKQICNVGDLRRWLDGHADGSGGLAATEKTSRPIYMLPFDHVYPVHELDAFGQQPVPVVVMYADITSLSFVDMYRLLYDAATGGRVRLVLRYKPSADTADPLYLSGYGVELAVKSTEYKAVDDRNVKGKDNSGKGQPADAKSLPDRVDTANEGLLFEPEPVIRPLTQKQISTIGFRVTQYVVASSSPLDTLVRVSQDFLKYAHLLAEMPTNASLVSGAEKAVNRLRMIVQEPNAVFLNGRSISMRHFNSFELLRHMQEELRLVTDLKSLSWTTGQAIEILSTPLAKPIGHKWGECFDVRSDTAIMWLNNIETDSRYRQFPPSIHELLRPSYPGQLKYVRKNLMTSVVLVDLSNPQHLDTIMILFRFIDGSVPLRFGLVPLFERGDVTHPASVAAVATAWITHTLGKKAFRMFIERLVGMSASPRRVTSELVKTAFQLVTRKSFEDAIAETRTSSASGATVDKLDFTALETDVVKFARRLGITDRTGAVFSNGKHIDLVEGWQQVLIETYFSMTEHLAELVYRQRVTDKDDIYTVFMTMGNVYAKRNPLIFTSVSRAPVLIGWWRVDGAVSAFRSLPWMYNDRVGDLAESSVLVVGDFSRRDGFGFAVGALKAVAASSVATRIALVHTGRDGGGVSGGHDVWIDEMAMRTINTSVKNGLPRLTALLASIRTTAQNHRHDFDLGTDRGDVNVAAMRSAVKHVILSASGSRFQPGDYGVVVNARLIGPLAADELFDDSDFGSVLLYESSQRTSNLAELVGKLQTRSMDSKSLSDLVFWTQSFVASSMSVVASGAENMFREPQAPRVSPAYFASVRDGPVSFSVGDFSSAPLQITAVVDPVSPLGQTISGLLRVLARVDGVAVEVMLNPQIQLDEDAKLPLTRLYRFVLEHEPVFGSDGRREPVGARFERVPVAPLWTLGMHVAGPWLVRPTRSVYDLDNIKLSALQAESPAAAAQGVQADFVLQSILVEGHARDLVKGGPPRGLQFVLGTERNPNMVDTITMANLGYLQLKANPGVWHLRIREGRSREVYQLESLQQTSNNGGSRNGQQRRAAGGGGAGEAGGLLGDDGATVIVDSFEGVKVFPGVQKRPGMQDEDVLNPSKMSETSPSFLSSLTQRALGAMGIKTPPTDDPNSVNKTINVFSVASGHLYERFLCIMMVSVKQQTTSPVKFWLIENFLSPSFMAFLPHFAKTFGFEYELVTYKWPEWLREQTEKQRIIWGYKILFLDVLFPLKLDKVIFVDADQVVRADLRELVEMDLHGAVYGYTPFCDDRPEMDGFRFWKKGYWNDHLRGRPYHISALYVVDLDRFRQVAAGDRLRQQYHMLSADPNSLANLDQDLPNSMIHDIPMYSLPQEWLWCETWCSDTSLKRAKTIDLCNNPMTKEPKLDRARRILSEWEGLDLQVQRVRDAFEADQNLTGDDDELAETRVLSSTSSTLTKSASPPSSSSASSTDAGDSHDPSEL